MEIAVIGTGYVGLVTGTCLSDSGNEVTCVDVNEEKINMLNNGEIPIYEPGLKDLVDSNREEGRLKFTTDIKSSVEKASVVFIAVGTPMSDEGEANLEYVFGAARGIAKSMNGYKVIVDKSTVPVGTAAKVAEVIKSETSHDFDVVSNPEFLKEGDAINDFMKPDRVVIGADSDKAAAIMREIYDPFLRTFHPLILMDVKSAEMTKYASNCFLATKISFINEMSNLCEKAGANIDLVREGMGADRRIGYQFLFPGVGYGGSCFPKDVQALIHTGKSLGLKMNLMQAVEDVNYQQKEVMVHKIVDHYQTENAAGSLAGKKFAVWGLSFKPKTDDMREAPSIVIINELLKMGAAVSAFDPEAEHEAKKEFADKIEYKQDMYDVLEGADALLLITEWPQFQRPSITKMKGLLKEQVIFDGRNVFHAKKIREQGFTYYGMGRQ